MRQPATVLFAAGDWWTHSHAHADFQMAQRLATGQPLLFVNSLGLRRPAVTSLAGRKRILRKLRSLLRLPREVAPGLFVMSPVFVPTYQPGWLAKFNGLLIAAQVHAFLLSKRLRPSSVVLSNPVAIDAAKAVGGDRLTMYRVDWNSRLRDGDGTSIAAFEALAFGAADCVVYTSQSLMEIEQPLVGVKAAHLPHGVDLERFSAVGLWDADGPIGFVGALDEPDRLQQLANIARAMPSSRFLWVGARPGTDAELADGVPPNVELVEAVPHDAVPALLHRCSVLLLIVPTDPWGQVALPIKLGEYLATGIPIVATRTQELERYAPPLLLAETATEFVEQIAFAKSGADGATVNSRRSCVEDRSWDSQASRFSVLIGASQPLLPVFEHR